MNALGVLFNAEAARGLTETYVFDVDGDVFTARVEEGELEPVLGAVDDADLRVEMDKCTFYDVAVGRARAGSGGRSGPCAGGRGRRGGAWSAASACSAWRRASARRPPS